MRLSEYSPNRLRREDCNFSNPCYTNQSNLFYFDTLTPLAGKRDGGGRQEFVHIPVPNGKCEGLTMKQCPCRLTFWPLTTLRKQSLGYWRRKPQFHFFKPSLTFSSRNPN